ncbi:MAG: alpha/beta hydrolase [Clostridiales Family XIII bacterium]|jgi:acetyl esterase/lipase|nr:alpha/beta hydrolase [Clostridiales Family XIII bacterium]
MTKYTIERVALPDEPDSVFLTRYIPGGGQAICPPVVICPGGGYFTIGTSEGDPVARRFLAAGYAPFILNYSILKDARFDRNAHPPIKAVSDLAKAFSVIRSHSQAWHLDKDRLILAGFSAGGHVAATYLGEATGAMPGLILPKAVLLSYPLISQNKLNKEQYSGRAPDPDDVRSLIYYYMFGEEGPSAEDEAAFDAANRVAPGWPDTFLYHSIPDEMVPYESSVRLDRIFTDNGIPHKFYTAEMGVHAHPFEYDIWWEPFLEWLSETI